MDAVILAGGLGTRLREKLPGLPKAMAPIAGRPVLAWLLDELVGAGFRRVILSVGHLADAIRSALGETYRALELTYAVERTPLGTGGALRHSLGTADAGDRPIWVMNGDTMLKLDRPSMWAAHQSRCGDPRAITLASVPISDTARYGALEVRDGRVLRFGSSSGPGLINAGTYLLHRRVFDGWDLPPAFSLESDFLAPFVHRLQIAAFSTDGWFIDIGVPADYERAQTEVPVAFSRSAARIRRTGRGYARARRAEI